MGRLDLAKLGVDSQEEALRSILGETWEHAKVHYRMPETINGFTFYVRRLINAVKRNQYSLGKKSATAGQAIIGSPYSVAKAEGIGFSTLYKLIARGIVPTQRRGKKIELRPGWQDAIRQWQRDKAKRQQQTADNKQFARHWADKRGITYASADTQIDRLRSKQGLNNKQISIRIGLETASSHEKGQITLSDGSRVPYTHDTRENILLITLDDAQEPDGLSKEINDRCVVHCASNEEWVAVELCDVSKGISLKEMPRRLAKVVEPVARKLNLPLSEEITK